MQLHGRLSCLAAAMAIAGCGGGGEISGTINGLSADGLVLTNGSETLAIDKDATRFRFATALADKAVYAVTVVTQPLGLRCTVTDGTGVIDANGIAPDVRVDCVAVFTVSGTVSGLRGNGLVVDDGRDKVAIVPGAPTFAFPTPLASGTEYAVVVATQPAGQTCSVANGTGTITDAAVANVSIQCR